MGIVTCDHNYDDIDNQVYGDDVTDDIDNTTGDDDDNFCGKDIKAGNRGVLCPLLTFGMCAVSFQGPAVGRRIMRIFVGFMMMMMMM